MFQNVILEDETDKNDVLRQKRGADRQYSFDVVFGEDSTQEEVYKVTTSSLVKDVLNGYGQEKFSIENFLINLFRYNATVFAYGATGAGKTHTMVGDAAQPGIMIRALNDLFQAVKDKENEYSVSNNQIYVYE